MRGSPLRKDRAWALRRVAQVLEGRHDPRFHMVCALALAGVVGFLASCGLLRVGLESMWLRYPLAACAGYGVFLLCVCVTALWYRRRRPGEPEPDVADIAARVTEDGGEARLPKPARSNDGDRWGWIGSLVDLCFEGLPAMGALIVVVVLAVVLALCFVSEAPTFFAELALDAVLVGGLGRTLVRPRVDPWWLHALRRSAVPALIAVGVLAVCGLLLQLCAPGAVSLREALARF